MDFDIDTIISEAKNTKKELEYNSEEIMQAPTSIQIKESIELKSGYMQTLKDLITGLPKELDGLLVKMPGTCMYYPYNENKAIMIADEPHDMHFRIGQAGEIHTVNIPAGN